MHGISYPQQEERIVAFCHQHGAKKVVVEENGPGIPVIEHLPQLFRETGVSCQVIGFTTTAQSKSLIVNSLAVAFERSGAVWLLPDEVQQAEFEAYEETKTPAGNTTYGAPEGEHDDTVIAAALAWTEIAPKRRSMIGPKAHHFGALRKRSYVEGRGTNLRQQRTFRTRR